MRDYGDFARNAVRVWLRQVMDEKGWSANEWASMAGTSPTNITRFLAPLSKIMPSVDTVAKLAMVARSQPNLMGYPSALLDTEATSTKAPVNFCPDCGYDFRGLKPRNNEPNSN